MVDLIAIVSMAAIIYVLALGALITIISIQCRCVFKNRVFKKPDTGSWRGRNFLQEGPFLTSGLTQRRRGSRVAARHRR